MEFLNQLGEFLKTPAGMVALLILAFFGLVGAVMLLKETRKCLGRLVGHPTWGDIVIHILPYVDQAIVAAFKASEKAADAFGDRLQAIDKKAIADIAWGLLPDIQFGPFTWNLQDHVSQPVFAYFVQERFDELIALWDESADLLLKEIKPELYKVIQGSLH